MKIDLFQMYVGVDKNPWTVFKYNVSKWNVNLTTLMHKNFGFSYDLVDNVKNMHEQIKWIKKLGKSNYEFVVGLSEEAERSDWGEDCNLATYSVVFKKPIHAVKFKLMFEPVSMIY